MIRGILVGALATAGALIAFRVYVPGWVRWFWATELERTSPRPPVPHTGPNRAAPVQVPTGDTRTPQTAAWCGKGWTK